MPLAHSSHYWRAKDIGGCVLWLPPPWESNITTVDAAILDPNDFTTGNWTKNACTAPDYRTIRDTATGPIEHWCQQNPTALQSNHATKLTCRIYPGTKTYAAFFANGVSAHVNLSTGATVAASGVTVSQTDGPGGSRDWQFAWVTAGAYVGVGPAVASSPSYTGDGTGDIYVENVVISQRNGSLWKDASGNADDFESTVAADRPELDTSVVPPRWNGDRTSTSTSVTDHFKRVAAGQVGAGSAGTIVGVIGRPLNSSSYVCSGSTGNDAAIIYGFTAGLLEWYNSTGGGPDRYTLKSSPDANLHVVALRQTNGVALQGWFDGVSAFGPVVPLSNWNGFRWFGGYSPSSNAWGGAYCEWGVWSRSLDDVELKQAMRGMGARWRIAVA